MKRILFVPDVHRPYHDKRAWKLFLKAAKRFKPDILVQLGDFADFYAVSAHDKDPKRALRFDEEVADVNVGLDELEAIGASVNHITLGNHCHRLQRYLQTKAPELYSVLSVEELFQLKKRGWKVTQYREHLRIGALNITHDTGKAGKYAVSRSQGDFEGNAVIGHVHSMSVVYAGNAKGKTHVGASFGWLGDVNQCDYMHKIVALRSWQLGFGIGFLEPNGTAHLQAIPIVNGRCVVNGELIQ
jgi:hypothetical protein